MLANLLSNAVKYNRSGGWVRLQALARGDEAGVEVSDNGLGIAPERLEGLFEPFNRLGRERSGVEGTGIGLALSRSLVEAMGGRIEVRSDPGAGSAFCVVLQGASPAA